MAKRVHPAVALNRRHFVQSLIAGAALGCSSAYASELAQRGPMGALAGQWRLALDPNDLGLEEAWHAKSLQSHIDLPGSLEHARVGNAVTPVTPWTGDINDKSFFTEPEYAAYRQPGNIKVPFFLQPDTWYRGPAWYQRDIDVPASWQGKPVELFLERPHWETRVWVDDRACGRNDALHVPHHYDLGVLTPGVHRLTVRVDNRMIVEIGHNGHGVTDHTQGNWNGIAGRIELRAHEPVWIEGVDLYPALSDRTLRVKGRIGNVSGKAGKGTAQIAFAGKVTRAPVTWDARGGAFEAAVVVDPANGNALRPWDEFSPVLHGVSVSLSNGAEWHGRFGWRAFTGSPQGFGLNGRPVMLRGALDCCIFPNTGHPPTDIGAWRRIMGRVKDYGLNHLRFHSYCPPEAAFDAADEAGIYLQVETMWANQSAAIGIGKPVDRWVYEESDRILAAHGNHPSFVLMTHGNEPGGGGKAGEPQRDAFLATYVRHYREKDSRRLWTSGAGWPIIEDNQYHNTPTPRVQGWGEGLKSRINSKPPETVTDYRAFVSKYAVPVISHEIGQWCVYPNLAEIRKYTGYLKPKNFEIFRDRLRESGLLDLAPEFLYASGRLQVLCYKEDIESALRTPGMGGFQLLGLQDFPGQGTALVGVLDPFWDDKGYISPTEYRRFCSPVVPLARLKTRVVHSGENLPFTVDVANFGAAPLADATITWSVVAHSGQVLAKGTFSNVALPLGNQPLDLEAAPALSSTNASAARLVVQVASQGNIVGENDWDLWIYPRLPAKTLPSKVRLAGHIDGALLDHLKSGGDVLLGVAGDKVTNHAKHPVQLGFSSIFWNTLWTNQQAPTTLGVLCDPEHPALGGFPTDGHSNWQWWYPLQKAGALRLDLLPPGVKPIVRIIDDWFTARPLGLIVELAVGKGRIIVCGFPIEGETANNAVSQNLIVSLIGYMGTSAFAPAVSVSADQLKSLVQA